MTKKNWHKHNCAAAPAPLANADPDTAVRRCLVPALVALVAGAAMEQGGCDDQRFNGSAAQIRARLGGIARAVSDDPQVCDQAVAELYVQYLKACGYKTRLYKQGMFWQIDRATDPDGRMLSEAEITAMSDKGMRRAEELLEKEHGIKVEGTAYVFPTEEYAPY